MGGLIGAWGLNALSSLPGQHNLFDQYSVMLTAWLFLAVIETLGRFRQVWRQRAVLGLVLVSLAIQVSFTSSLTADAFALGPAPISAVRAAVQAIPRGSMVYTTSALGPWAANRRVFGTDSLAAPGVMLDPLSVVWRVGRQDGATVTALLARAPMNPYFGYLMAEALASGYQPRYMKGGVVLLVGRVHFAAMNPQETMVGLEPLGTTWSEPWWSQEHNLTAVGWKTDALRMAATGRRRIVATLSLWMAAGRYDLTFRASTSVVPARLLGWWTVRAKGGKSFHGVAREGFNTLKVSLPSSTLVTIKLGNTGKGTWTAGPLEIHGTSTKSPADLGMEESPLYLLESGRPRALATVREWHRESYSDWGRTFDRPRPPAP